MNATRTSAHPTKVSGCASFVLVNDRVPRAGAVCARCSAQIENGYVRQPQTHLVYCNLTCFTGRGRMAITALLSRKRRAS